MHLNICGGYILFPLWTSHPFFRTFKYAFKERLISSPCPGKQSMLLCLLAGTGSLHRQMQPVCHLAGGPPAPGQKTGHANKELQFTWEWQWKCEETDRVCPQPNPFCLSTFDLNSSRNTGSTVLGQYWKGQRRQCQTWSVVAVQVLWWRCITIYYSGHGCPGALRASLYLSGSNRSFPFLSLLFSAPLEYHYIGS